MIRLVFDSITLVDGNAAAVQFTPYVIAPADATLDARSPGNSGTRYLVLEIETVSLTDRIGVASAVHLGLPAFDRIASAVVRQITVSIRKSTMKMNKKQTTKFNVWNNAVFQKHHYHCKQHWCQDCRQYYTRLPLSSL